MFRKDLQSLQHEFEKVGNPYFEDTKIVYTLVAKNEMIHLQTNLFMRLELLEQNSILHAKKENIGNKSIYETLNIAGYHCMKIQTLLSYSKHRKK